VYALASRWIPAARAAFWAAAFFAVHEGHQEAVIWFSGFTEPAMLVFGLGAMLCWLRAGESARGWLWNTAGVALFALALISKDTAAIWLSLFLLALPRADWRRAMVRLIPYGLLALVAAASILASSGHSFRFSDGSFSLSAPFWITWPRGFARLLWPWGWLALVACLPWWGRPPEGAPRAGPASRGGYSSGEPAGPGGPARTRESAPQLQVGMSSQGLSTKGMFSRGMWFLFRPLAWIAIGLLPYSFLTYSMQIPSRHTYLASAGLALLFGLAVARLEARPHSPGLAAGENEDATWGGVPPGPPRPGPQGAPDPQVGPPAEGRTGAGRPFGPADRGSAPHWGWHRHSKTLVTAVVVVALVENMGVVWTRKRRQFVERARPTEQLIGTAQQARGPIWVRCFPRNHWIAEAAVYWRAGLPPSSLIWDEAEAARRRPAVIFCYQEIPQPKR